MSSIRRNQTKKLGILLSTPPDHQNLDIVLNLAYEALSQGIEVYLYLIDDGVYNINNKGILDLSKKGVRLFACALAAQRRGIPLSDKAVFGGLYVLLNMMNSCDRFLAFN